MIQILEQQLAQARHLVWKQPAARFALLRAQRLSLKGQALPSESALQGVDLASLTSSFQAEDQAEF